MLLLNSQYNFYIRNIIKFVRSIKINSLHTAATINTYLSAGGDIITDVPTTWKYYRNLNGLRYIGTTGYYDDPIITIISLDTDEIINFDYNTLLNHPITLATYRKKAGKYDSLLNRFPEQELLIDGVLNPIDMATAINAKDYEILYYNQSLLESNELNVIAELQSFIYRFTDRWDLPAYRSTDSLYAAASLGILYLQLVPEIINIRLKNCHTEHVHSYHVWNYLGGFFGLNRFKSNMPKDQALWLYRNIAYLTAHGGCRKILDYLNTEFIIPFGLTLNKYDIYQSSVGVLDKLTNNELTNLSNTPIIKLTPYNGNDNTVKPKVITTTALATKLFGYGLQNKKNSSDDIAALDSIPILTSSNLIPTGLIECGMVKATAKNIVDSYQEKLHNWLYLADTGYIKYNHIFTFTNQLVSTLTVTAKEAAVILLYCTIKYFNKVVANIEPVIVRDVMYIPELDRVDIEGVIESKYLSGKIFISPTETLVWNRYNDIYSSLTLPKDILTKSDFLKYMADVLGSKIQHTLLLGLESSALGSDEIKSLTNMFYTTRSCTFVSETTYANFFTRIGLDFSTFTKAQLLNVISDIVNNSIGLSADINDYDTPYSNILEILRLLTSYTIQIVDADNLVSSIPTDWCFMNLTAATTANMPIFNIWDGLDLDVLLSGSNTDINAVVGLSEFNIDYPLSNGV